MQIFCKLVFVFPLEMTVSFFHFAIIKVRLAETRTTQKGKDVAHPQAVENFRLHCLTHRTAFSVRLRIFRQI